MGRGPRIHYPGAVYHAMARGVDGRDIFVDDRDREFFLDALNRVCANASADVLAYCLMGNHFHVAIKVGMVPLAEIMQRVLTGYSLAFNRRHDRTGHLFQARYKAIVCLNDAYLAALIRYIHMNPVRAGIVLKPQDWPWSSLRGEVIPFNPENGIADFDPWRKGTLRNIDLQRGEDEGKHRNLDDLGAMISARTGINHKDLRSDDRRRSVIAAKRMLTREALNNGHKLIAIARWMNLDPSSISRYARSNTANCKA